MKRILSLLLCWMLFFTALSLPAAAEQAAPGEETRQPEGYTIPETEPADAPAETRAELPQTDEPTDTGSVDVTQYSYAITPLLAPFPYFLYVQTDNPDPESFRLVDRDSRYFTSSDHAEIQVRTSDYSYSITEIEAGSYYIEQTLFPDVTFENAETYRVPGGYLFRTRRTFSDGGAFVLQQRTIKGKTIRDSVYADTAVTVSCPVMKIYTDYLIDTYTNPSDSFFAKMDAVQAGLERIAIYPRRVYDTARPNAERPYPFLAVSPYAELSMNEHYEMFREVYDGLLLMNAYPYILDSASFPGTMQAVARTLAPECTVEGSAYHWEIEVTYGGETRTYGGAGTGGNDPLYTDRVEHSFTFGGSDLGSDGTIDGYLAVFGRYAAAARADASAYRDLIAGDTFAATIAQTGGTWVQVAAEGHLGGYGTTFGYVVPFADRTWTASKVWVGNIYVNEYETLSFDTFDQHPTASILVHDVSYTDINGIQHRQDVIYDYNSDTDTWTAPLFYVNRYWYSTGMKLPDEFILTREQVEAMHLSEGRKHLPASGLIYDGTERPGTPFEYVLVEGITMPETFTLLAGERKKMDVRIEPEDALEKRVNWESTDEEIAYAQVWDNYHINGKKTGTVTMTATTVDGQYTASCVVTVEPNLAFELQPEDVTVPEHYDATFTAAVQKLNNNGGALQLLWQQSTDGETWTDLLSETTATLTFPVTAADSGKLYRLKAWNEYSEIFSEAARLTVTPWVPPTYVITFDPNGGTCETESVSVTLGNAIGTLPTPTRYCYAFNGWFTERTGGTQITANWMPTESFTVYAQWTRLREFVVMFDLNGGDAISPSYIWVVEGEPIGPLPTPTRSGYAFLGWFTSRRDNADPVTETFRPTNDIIISAHWEEIPPPPPEPSYVMSTAANFMGKMLVNYYIVMSEEALADKDAYVEIKLNDDVKKVLVRDADTDEKNGVLRHKFEMEVPSKCMRDDIVLKLHAGNGSLLPLTYKQETDVTEGFVYHMVDYLRGRQQNSTSETMRRLAYTAEWYGTACQLYFNHHVNQLTEAEIAAMNTALNDASIMTGLANYAPIEGGTLPNGITKRSNTVVFESDNTLRTYFYTANPNAYTFTMDDNEIHLNEWEAGKYNYDIPNIPGKELAKWHKVTATDGTNTYTYKTSALGYCYGRAANSSNVDMQNLAKTLYLYGKAAMAYFGVPDEPAPTDTPAVPDAPAEPVIPESLQGRDIQLPIVP